MSINLTWLGHAAFLLEAEGTHLLLDPYDSACVGTYLPIDVCADAIFVSHENAKYHSYWPGARGNPRRINGLDLADGGSVTVGGAVLRAVQVWESPARVVAVSMPCVEIEGIHICHSGDLGHGLSDEEVAQIGPCDIFLAVAGGPPTVTLPDLKAAIDKIKPRIVIPMHFGNDKINLPLLPVGDFLALFDPAEITLASSATWTVSPNMLPAQTTILVLPSLL